jgi:hypothetical protein
LSPSALVDAARPVAVVWNGVAHGLRLGPDGMLRLTDPAYRPAALRKTTKLPGSINDLFNTPFAVVVGTSSKDPRTRELCRARGEQFKKAWEQWQKYPPRYFLDTEITPAEIAKYSLILIGGADANGVTAKLAAGIPLKVSGETITVGTGRDARSFHAPDAGVQLIYPNPRNPERYVLVAAGTSPMALGYVAPAPRNLVEWDFVIDDGHVPAFKQWSTLERTRVASGMFDQNWRIDPAYIVTGDAKARAAGRHLGVPRGAQPDNALVSAIEGDYQIENGPPATVFRKDGKLYLKAGSDDGELEFTASSQFYLPRFQVWIDFTRDAAGKVDGFTGWGHGDFEAKRQ